VIGCDAGTLTLCCIHLQVQSAVCHYLQRLSAIPLWAWHDCVQVRTSRAPCIGSQLRSSKPLLCGAKQRLSGSHLIFMRA
jgi:hypothetical protein